MKAAAVFAFPICANLSKAELTSIADGVVFADVFRKELFTLLVLREPAIDAVFGEAPIGRMAALHALPQHLDLIRRHDGFYTGRSEISSVCIGMPAKIRVKQALLFRNGIARVEWEGPNGKREKESPHEYSWVKKLAKVVDSDPELKEASINRELDVRGTLRWDEFELDLEFDPDPEHDGHTRTVLIRLVQDS